jgi:hypothetical protein
MNDEKTMVMLTRLHREMYFLDKETNQIYRAEYKDEKLYGPLVNTSVFIAYIFPSLLGYMLINYSNLGKIFVLGIIFTINFFINLLIFKSSKKIKYNYFLIKNEKMKAHLLKRAQYSFIVFFLFITPLIVWFGISLYLFVNQSDAIQFLVMLALLAALPQFIMSTPQIWRRSQSSKEIIRNANRK